MEEGGMRIRTAVLTGLTGLMLNVGLGNDVLAQPTYRYYGSRNGSLARRHGGEQWQAEQLVRQAYIDVLRREPDPTGLRDYTDAMLRRGWSAADVRRALARSPEYAQRFGSGRWSRGWDRNPRYR
jgi:uncharacterized protein DUF4214